MGIMKKTGIVTTNWPSKFDAHTQYQQSHIAAADKLEHLPGSIPFFKHRSKDLQNLMLGVLLYSKSHAGRREEEPVA